MNEKSMKKISAFTAAVVTLSIACVSFRIRFKTTLSKNNLYSSP